MTLPVPNGYRPMDEAGLRAFLAERPALRGRLGGPPDAWRIGEVGDGNLNLVFLVEGPAGSLCVKQALPYVRLVGEGWPMRLERALYEWRASTVQAANVGRLIPQMLHYDERLYLIVMERLQPHIIMRRGTIQAVVYPRFVEDITEYLANALYQTSDLALPAERKKALIADFAGNTELCKITEDLIFTDPYMVHERNRWTSPQLDAEAAAIRGDGALKRKVSELKVKFMTDAQALLHGDLHTGSIMITQDDTRVIDPEFALVGPMGFDVGKLLGNLLLAFFSQAGHETRAGEREAYRAWLLETTEGVWIGFERKFLALWRERRTGDAYPQALLPEGSIELARARKDYMARLWNDAVGYAGTSMIRRTLGLAHNADLETIADPDRRAGCERKVLRLGRELIIGSGAIGSIAEVTARAREIEAMAR
jgi:5-methylthioribose kinase